ncbi:unnamed protein product, partial [Boreogadus saida]
MPCTPLHYIHLIGKHGTHTRLHNCVSSGFKLAFVSIVGAGSASRESGGETK